MFRVSTETMVLNLLPVEGNNLLAAEYGLPPFDMSRSLGSTDEETTEEDTTDEDTTEEDTTEEDTTEEEISVSVKLSV